MFSVKIQYISGFETDDEGKTKAIHDDEYVIAAHSFCCAEDDTGHKVFMVDPIHSEMHEFMPAKGKFSLSSEFASADIFCTNEEGNTIAKYRLRCE